MSDSLEIQARELILANRPLAEKVAEIMATMKPVEPRKPAGMTFMQKKVLDFIKAYAAKNFGVTPTYDEIAAHIGVASKSSVSRLILALEERGRISRLQDRARSITIIGDDA